MSFSISQVFCAISILEDDAAILLIDHVDKYRFSRMNNCKFYGFFLCDAVLWTIV